MRTTSAAVAAVAVLLAASSAHAHWGVAGHVHHGYWAAGWHPGWPAVRTVVAAPPQGVVDFNVTPPETRIWVDGTYRGTCDEFDGYPQKMYLKPGTHRIQLRSPDGREIRRTVELGPGYELNLNLAF